MINWDEFEHLHVIRKLKQILNTWWNIDIVFTDDRGRVRGFYKEKTKMVNPSTEQFLTRDAALDNFAEVVSAAMGDLRQSGNRYQLRRWDMSGYDLGVFPIVIDSDFVGAVCALGFFKDPAQDGKMAETRERMAAFGLAADIIERSLSMMKFLDDKEKAHCCQLVDLVAEEIVTLHLEISKREERITELNKELGSRYKYDSMIGKSKPMQQLYALLDKIKVAESTVLVQGENGTGKELIAKSIHYNSPRKEKPFVIQNCSAFNDNLLESELFGHVKGSFTGAVKDKKGLFELADRGTFFLDEIGDTSPTMQVKLLRVLQEGTFIPVGGIEPRRVDVRIIAATNRDLKGMVEGGTFREDLYYRLNVINIHVPSLRDRKEDIPLLIDYFLDRSTKASGKPKKIITKQALEKLYDYAWPGNIRELQNEIERLVVLAGDEQKITGDMLSGRIIEDAQKGRVQGARIHGKLKDALDELEREMIKEGLRRTGWNKSKLAKELGISRAGLIMKVEKYGLDKRRLAKT